ncbi:MAG: AraC family transcriptional regulator [Pleomorphochaeta sp.]
MKIEKCIKKTFSVMGKQGSTNDGDSFIEKLWIRANTNFPEVADIAKKDEKGNLIGVWGLMSDFSHSFKPWEENFSKGLYLAGVEIDNNQPPIENWVKWSVPSFEYLCVEVENENTFNDVINYMKENQIELVGAVHDFRDSINNKNYMYFPIRKIEE